MTQFEYYTMLLRAIALFGAYVFGTTAIVGFAVLTYCLYPFFKK
jgi:hypothetical protein